MNWKRPQSFRVVSERRNEKSAYLEAQDLRLDERQRTTVDLDQTTARLDDNPKLAFPHVGLNLESASSPKMEENEENSSMT